MEKMTVVRLFLVAGCVSVFLLLLSCSQGTRDAQSGGNDSVSVTQPDAVAPETLQPPGEGEDFYAFLREFSDDESFQMRRVVFPVTAIISDVTHQGMAPTEGVISKYDWEPLDLYYDSTFLTRSYDQYYQTVRFAQDTAVVELRGINNGIYADYYFKLIDDKWFLVGLSEVSF